MALYSAADRVDPETEYHFVRCLDRWHGANDSTQNLLDLRPFAQLAAIKGHKEAQWVLRVLVRREHVPQNMQEALLWILEEERLNGVSPLSEYLRVWQMKGDARRDAMLALARWSKYDRAINAAGYILEGNTKDVTPEPDKARELYTEGAAQGFGQAACNLGLCFDDSGDSESAALYYRQAAEVGLKDGRFNLALLLMRDAKENHDEINALLATMLQARPTDPDVRDLRGRWFTELEDFDRAEKEFSAVDTVYGVLGRARLCELRNDSEGSHKLYLTAIEEYNNEWAMEVVAYRNLVDYGNEEEALKYFKPYDCSDALLAAFYWKLSHHERAPIWDLLSATRFGEHLPTRNTSEIPRTPAQEFEMGKILHSAPLDEGKFHKENKEELLTSVFLPELLEEAKIQRFFYREVQDRAMEATLASLVVLQLRLGLPRDVARIIARMVFCDSIWIEIQAEKTPTVLAKGEVAEVGSV